MTLNRLYNFSPGQTIQSAQVNAEFDQMITTVNTNVLDANFLTNNIVADGNIVTALGALDSYLGDNPPGGAMAYNFSRNVILQYDDLDTREVKLKGSDLNKIVLAKNADIYMENTEVSITLPTSEGFHDIYIEEETSYDELIQGAKRIKLATKFADDTPYSTTPSEGQILIGCAYVNSSELFGLHSLETPNATSFHTSSWSVDDNHFDHTIASTLDSYSTKTSIIPVFVKSAIHYNVQTQIYTTGSGTVWNFDFKILMNSSLEFISRERVHPLDPSSDMGRTGKTYTDRRFFATPGVYEFEYGGKLGDDDASECTIVIEKLYAMFSVYPQNLTFKAH